MADSEFQWKFSKFGEVNSEKTFFIGGSTMSGKGITGSTYAELFSIETGQSVLCYTKNLVQLNEVISLIDAVDMSNARVYVNCGAGDQMRVINPKALKFLPHHWGKPAHMEAPVNYSTLTIKRIRQKRVLLVKYFVKYIVKIFGLYQNTTSLKNFREQLQQLALVAHKRALRIYWIDSVVGDYRVPAFIRRERAMYSQYLVREYIGTFPEGSVFLSFDGYIESTDFLDDGYHLNLEGHKKICNLLTNSKCNQDHSE